jgi:hypothetical protein
MGAGARGTFSLTSEMPVWGQRFCRLAVQEAMIGST